MDISLSKHSDTNQCSPTYSRNKTQQKEKRKNDLESQYYNAITKLGIIADVQYCDKDDASNWDGTQFRRYRETLNVTRRAAKSFEKTEVGAIIQLGDAIDGKSKDNFMRYFNDILCPILQIPVPKSLNLNEPDFPESIPRLDVIGNHDLYCAPREELRYILSDYDMENDLLCYSKEIAGGNWRIIVLDSYAISVLGFTESQISDPSCWKFQNAQHILKQHNPKALEEIPHRPPKGKERYGTWNGGIGPKQLQWLEGELVEAWNKQQFVVIFSHIPITGFDALSQHWDVEELQKLIRNKVSHVVACIGGHRHTFSHRLENENGSFIHHLDIPSPLLAPVGGEAHAILEFSVREMPVSIGDEIIAGIVPIDHSNAQDITKPPPFQENLRKTQNSSLLFDKNVVYTQGGVSIINDEIGHDNVSKVGIIEVKGFGEMPKILYLAKPVPMEWSKKINK